MKKTQKNSFYFCENCQFKTNNKNDYSRHILTAKHTLRISGNDLVMKAFCCEVCSKTYKSAHGLWYHKKKCEKTQKTQNPENGDLSLETLTDKQVIYEVLKQNKELILENKEFKELIMNQSSLMLEQNSKMCEIVSKQSTTINNNCNNTQFNLNLFLNEKCKNAMNMSDFVNSLTIMDDDFEDMGKLGYVQGITNIFIKGLKDLDETARPLHCSDIKRDIIYIKDNDVWGKDNNKDKLKKVIADIAHKNVKYIPIWRDANPEALDGTTKKNVEYMRIANQIMTATTPDDENGINKIIRNVASMVCIDK